MNELLTNFEANQRAMIAFLKACFPSVLGRQDFEDAIIIAYEKLYLNSLRAVPTLAPTLETMRYLSKLACVDIYRKKMKERELVAKLPFCPNVNEEKGQDSPDILERIEQILEAKTPLQQATFEKFHLCPKGNARIDFKNRVVKVTDKMLAERFKTTVGYVKQVRHNTLTEIREAIT
jgi:hypothetical protein